MSKLYPLKFKTIFKDKIWGGQKIKTVLNKDFGDLPNCGETWEISGVEGNISVVSEGSLKGEDLQSLVKKFPKINGAEDIFSPVGTANAYDAMHLLAKAINKAGSTEGDAIRNALENLDSHKGLIKTYDRAFTPDNHDALNENDYIMVRFVGNTITPME